MTTPRITLSTEEPHPTLVAVFSSADIQSWPPDPYSVGCVGRLLGVPAVVAIDGTPMRIRTSPYVPPGEVYVMDITALTPTTGDDPQ